MGGRNWLGWLLALALFAVVELALAGAAHAERIVLMPLSMQLASCTAITEGSETACGTAVSTTGQVVPSCDVDEAFCFWTAFPPNVANSWQFAPYWETDSTHATDNEVCWRFDAVAYDDAQTLTTYDPAAGDAPTPQVSEDLNSGSVGDTLRIGPLTTAVAIFDHSTNTDCASTDCQRNKVLVHVRRVSTGACSLNELTDAEARFLGVRIAD